MSHQAYAIDDDGNSAIVEIDEEDVRRKVAFYDMFGHLPAKKVLEVLDLPMTTDAERYSGPLWNGVRVSFELVAKGDEECGFSHAVPGAVERSCKPARPRQ
jgi:hypothetical protein